MKVADIITSTNWQYAMHAMGFCYNKRCNYKALVNACKAGHWSLLEHINVTMELMMSQKCLAQFSRHRHFSLTVQSTRGQEINNGCFLNFEKPIDVGDTKWQQFLLEQEMAYNTSVERMKKNVEDGIPVEYASYGLPLGSMVKLQVTGNLRTWMEYLQKRLCRRASDEHLKLAIQIFTVLNQAYPYLCNTTMLGICQNCTEVSCDFTSHKPQPKNPILKELVEFEIKGDV